MARLAKKALSTSSSSKLSSSLKSTTERRPGLKASLLTREVNEFLHAPKITKREKKEEQTAKLVERAKSSSILAASTSTSTQKKSSSLINGKINKNSSNNNINNNKKIKKAEKQKRKRIIEAENFNSSIQQLLEGLPSEEELKKNNNNNNNNNSNGNGNGNINDGKNEIYAAEKIKKREAIIKYDSKVFKRNILLNESNDSKKNNDDNNNNNSTNKSLDSPLSRLSAMRQQLAKSLGKTTGENENSQMDLS